MQDADKETERIQKRKEASLPEGINCILREGTFYRQKEEREASQQRATQYQGQRH
jgi:hypothetical protein